MKRFLGKAKTKRIAVINAGGYKAMDQNRSKLQGKRTKTMNVSGENRQDGGCF